jgi:nicotinamide-nucleotide amidase
MVDALTTAARAVLDRAKAAGLKIATAESCTGGLIAAILTEIPGSMAEGALAHSRADIALAVTGIAGPRGGSAEKPVGLVFIAAARRGQPAIVERHVFPGNRADIRQATVRRALDLLLSLSGG